jgi:PleD family two-component response regulator
MELSASIGIAIYGNHMNMKHFIQIADDALYTAKKNGRDQICFPENIIQL